MNSIFQKNGLPKITIPKPYEVFEFQNEDGHIKHVFKKREISGQINGETYFDLVPPVGFGGPMIVNCNSNQKWDLIFEFQQAFEAYCLEHRIVSEEVVFNPPFGNAIDFLNCYELQYVSDSYGIDVTNNLEEISVPDSSELWNAIDSGIEYRVLVNEEAMSGFKEFIKFNNQNFFKEVDEYFNVVNAVS